MYSYILYLPKFSDIWILNLEISIPTLHQIGDRYPWVNQILTNFKLQIGATAKITQAASHNGLDLQIAMDVLRMKVHLINKIDL